MCVGGGGGRVSFVCLFVWFFFGGGGVLHFHFPYLSRLLNRLVFLLKTKNSSLCSGPGGGGVNVCGGGGVLDYYLPRLLNRLVFLLKTNENSSLCPYAMTMSLYSSITHWAARVIRLSPRSSFGFTKWWTSVNLCVIRKYI